MQQKSLKQFIYLSLAAAVATILLKFYAFYLTGSTGFFSDALESFVNLIGAIMALIMLTISAKPADKEHEYGHTKAEYFSSAIEGALIVLAALSIIRSAVPRIIEPTPLENLNAGLLFSLGASLINLVVALILIENGKKKKFDRARSRWKTPTDRCLDLSRSYCRNSYSKTDKGLYFGSHYCPFGSD
jgi:cation diffusion facilitator family transporter